MAKTPEAKVKDAIKKILQKHEVYYAMPIGSIYSNAGTPDFLCCVNGLFLAIEAKAGKNDLTKLQEDAALQISRCKGEFVVIREDGLDFLEECIVEMKAENLNRKFLII